MKLTRYQFNRETMSCGYDEGGPFECVRHGNGLDKCPTLGCGNLKPKHSIACKACLDREERILDSFDGVPEDTQSEPRGFMRNNGREGGRR